MSTKTEVYDSVFVLMVNESIKYIFSKNLDKKAQKKEIEELGFQLGEKVSNHLLNQGISKINTEKNSIESYINFVAKEVFEFIFRVKSYNVEKENDGSNYIITTKDMKLYNILITEKESQNNPKLEAILNFVCGVIKGALNIFNVECIVVPNVGKESKSSGKDIKTFPEYQNIFSFNVNVFSDNKDLGNDS